jgi:hypothetical protein
VAILYFNITGENKMREVIIDGIKYIEQNKESSIKVVILQRGWNMIGRFQREGMDCTLTDAYVIRRWGTNKGLGQLAIEGMQSETVLDKVGIAHFDYLTVVAAFDCNQSKWDKNL